MFTKTLMLVLLSTTIVLASPVTQKDVDDQVPNGENLGQKYEDWLKEAGDILAEYHEHYKKTFQYIFNELKGMSGTAVKISNEKLATLKEKYDDIKMKAKETIEKKQKEWQLFLEKLKNEGDAAVEEFKEKTKEFIEQEKERLHVKLNKLKEKFTGAIGLGATK